MRGLTEVVPLQDIVCSGLGSIEHLEGNLLRFWLYVTQTEDDGSKEKIVVGKIIMPSVAVPDAVLKAIAALNGGPVRIIPMAVEPDMAH